MERFSRILMATDLSARSDRALERAVSIAREHKAPLSVVHVVDEDLPVAIAHSVQGAATKAIRDHLAAIPGSAETEIAVLVTLGRSYEAILSTAEAADSDLIVLGLHREDAFKDRFRGTTVERVIRFGQRPVLLVKERAREPYRRILVGMDFSVCSRRAVEVAMRMTSGGELHLVHAYAVPFRAFLHGRDTQRDVGKMHEDQMRQMLGKEFAAFYGRSETHESDPKLILRHGDVRQVLRDEASRIKADLLVVGTHGRTGVSHALLGSVAEDILRSPPCDVLAVKAW